MGDELFLEQEDVLCRSSDGSVGVCGVKEAKTIRYYNTLGTESSHPSKGINIMVTTHTDGTTSAKKILH